MKGTFSVRIAVFRLPLASSRASSCARKSSNILVASIHPGTTDSELSKPFQRNISPEKLYTAEQTADRLIAVMNNLSKHQHGKLLNWDGQLLPY